MRRARNGPLPYRRMIGGWRFLEFIDEPYRSRIHQENWTGLSIPYSWPTTGGLARPDAIPKNGRRAGADYDLMREQHLDAYDLRYAVLTGLLYPAEFRVQPDFAMRRAGRQRAGS